MKARLIAVMASLVIANSAMAEPASGPDRPLPDAAQEARARALFTDIRCVVCQHEAIADSPAAIAGDMRKLVREQIAAGRSDQDIREDLVRRYGEYVLFTPPFRAATIVLWLGPFLLAAGAGLVLLLNARRRRSDEASLSAKEEAELERFIGSTEEKPHE